MIHALIVKTGALKLSHMVSKKLSMVYMIPLLALFVRCEQKITVESTVHPDGAIDRTVLFTGVDSSFLNDNMFGLRPGDGWEAEMERMTETPDANVKETPRPKYTVRFQRSFTSAGQANKTMDTPDDSLFRIRSTFHKRFRWFYSYIDYTDTYASINRFRHFPQSDFFAAEDFAFIERLPASGRSISKADSVYLEFLTAKIYDHYMIAAVYEEHLTALEQAMKKNKLAAHWFDSLQHYRGVMFSWLSKDEPEDDAFEDAFFLQMLDSLNIGFPTESVAADYQQSYSSIKSRLDFMIAAAGGAKFTHIINMPWDVVDTNADSVSGSTLYWRPLPIKFMLGDYVMQGTARRLNYWAVILSAVVIVIAIAAFIKRK